MRDARDIASKARGHVWLRPIGYALCLTVSLALLPHTTHAFEIFGLKLFEDEASETLEIVDPLSYTVTLDVIGNDPDNALQDRLKAASQLVQGAERPVSGSIGLIQRANGDFEQLVAVLYENARYAGEVSILLNGRNLAGLPADANLEGQAAVPVRIVVTPGREFLFGDVNVSTSDGQSYDAGDTELVSGAVARSTVILDAETALIQDLRGAGHPSAKVSGRDVVADHANGVLDVSLTLDDGPVAAFGATSVDGAQSVDSDFIAMMAGVPEGERYDPEDLAAAARRLRALEVFSSVNVREGESLSADGSVPVGISVSERKHRYLGLGATFSSTDGGGMEAYWGHRNLFGRAEKFRLEGSFGGVGSTSNPEDLTWRGAALFEKPGVLGPASKFTSHLEVKQEDPDAYRRFSVEGGVGLGYELTAEQSVSAGLVVEYAKLTDSFIVDLETITVAVPLEYVRDTRNDKLNPVTGTRLALLVEPAYEVNSGATFVKLRAEGSAYQALDAEKRFVLAGRVAAGSIYGADLAEVPANRRFYAGGGGSVRGYGFQDIGPRDGAGTPTGGLSMLETSAELRIQITDTIGIVPFLDAGLVSSSESFSDSSFKAGAGVGLRYLTPFGPLRVDVALPLNKEAGDPDYGIYAGIGQAF
ncbi:Outer membrane protein [Hoeflea phototrophica DFL-43]|uniref:Outer membrane protein n=1 Tax=Hoeflea phototrophica (strain DSM 17068 / NCIMB 14078 / DFL-43) TaxID=411684 RepID=A9D5Z0_HOEPD|nr:autotransporter assembly complex family protein [Hoeflea phototrophica]EDQ33391.1 Outer membrane protein [Hoeflea phototrophica DFL-43]